MMRLSATANWEEYLDEGDWDDDEEIELENGKKDHRKKFDDQRF